MNLETIELEKTIHELKYELDRLKHEVKLLKITVDSHERRWDTQMKSNDTFFSWLKRLSNTSN